MTLPETDSVVFDLDEKIREAEEERDRLKNLMLSQKESYEAKIEQLQTRIHEVEKEQTTHARDSKDKKGADLDKANQRTLKYKEDLEKLRAQLHQQQELQADNKRLQKVIKLNVRFTKP
jgi:hypothetical protein